jgi:hypothetical protein
MYLFNNLNWLKGNNETGRNLDPSAMIKFSKSPKDYCVCNAAVNLLQSFVAGTCIQKWVLS